MPISRELTEQELQAIELQGLDSSAYRGKQQTLLTDSEVAAQNQEQPVVPDYSKNRESSCWWSNIRRWCSSINISFVSSRDNGHLSISTSSNCWCWLTW